MIEVRAAQGGEVAAWSTDWEKRIAEWYGGFGASDAWVDDKVQRGIAALDGTHRETHALVLDGVLAGFLTIGVSTYGPTTIASVIDLWVAPGSRRCGIGTAARQWAEQWARSAKLTLSAVINPADVASLALFKAYPIRFQRMMKQLVSTDALPAGVAGRSMTEPEYVPWRDATIHDYAVEMADAGLLSPEDAMARSVEQFDELLGDGLSTRNHTFWTLFAADHQVATNWLCHHYEPDTSFVFGVEVGEANRGQGYGRAAMIVGEQASIDVGDTYLALNVFGHNTVAINLYTKMGYQIVEQGRSIETA